MGINSGMQLHATASMLYYALLRYTQTQLQANTFEAHTHTSQHINDVLAQMIQSN